MNPLVSIITPVYNAMPYLEVYIDSVQNQSYTPIELILVDDGSTDDSLAYMKSREAFLQDNGIKVHILSQENQGQVAAVNAALPKVSGELLAWCDADDYFMKHSISRMAECLLANPELDMVRTNGTIIDNTANPITYTERENQPFIENIFDKLFHEQILLLAGRFMVRSEALFACYAGREIPASNIDQNFQLLLPIASRSSCAYINEPLHVYTRRSTGHSSQRRSFTEALKKIDDVKLLYLSILPYCLCNQQQYEQELDRIMLAAKKHVMQTTAMVARQDSLKYK